MSRRSPQALSLQTGGIALFAFIPLVLYLFVGHPEPHLLSLGAGVVLMLAHRVPARAYMRRAARRKCLWSNRTLEDGLEDSLEAGVAGRDSEDVTLRTAGGAVEARVLRRHARDLRRFFTFAHRARLPLRAGIFLPLLALLGTLGAAGFGVASQATLATVTDAFRLVIGLTVNVAAWGWHAVRQPDEAPRVPFPVHNFFLLGVRALLWILRLVGIWWIVAGAAGLLGA